MAGQKLSEESILAFRDNLILEEKSIYTTEKYLRDVCAFFRFAGAKPVTKELVMDYKKLWWERVMLPAPSIPCWHLSTVCCLFWAGATAG